MAYVHTPASRTQSAAQAVDDARLVIRHDRAIVPPGELIQGLGDAAPAAASAGFNWSGLATTLAQTVLPAAIQVGAAVYTARQQKKDLAKQEDMINAEAAAARQALAAQQQAMVMAQRQAPAGGISTSTVLLIGGVAAVGLLAVVLLTRRQ